MQGASKAEQAFKAGEHAPESGVYTVVHADHRRAHAATIFKGERFPLCGKCGDKVRFVLYRPAALISEDLDFLEGGSPENRK